MADQDDVHFTVIGNPATMNTTLVGAGGDLLVQPPRVVAKRPAERCLRHDPKANLVADQDRRGSAVRQQASTASVPRRCLPRRASNCSARVSGNPSGPAGPALRRAHRRDRSAPRSCANHRCAGPGARRCGRAFPHRTPERSRYRSMAVRGAVSNCSAYWLLPERTPPSTSVRCVGGGMGRCLVNDGRVSLQGKQSPARRGRLSHGRPSSKIEYTRPHQRLQWRSCASSR